MEKYIDAEKLIAEIDRQKIGYNTDGEHAAGYNTCRKILDIIGSLRQEQPEVDLKKEIDSCWQDWISPSNQSSVEGVLPKSEFSMYACHFYELGLRRAAEMYDEIEYNRQRANEEFSEKVCQ
jgi:hypothetical protein